MWGWFAKTASACLVLTVVAVAVMFSPVSSPIVTYALYTALAAGAVTLGTGCLYLGHVLSEREKQELSLNAQERAVNMALQARAFSAPEGDRNNAAIVQDTAELKHEMAEHKASINQLQLEKTNLENRVRNGERRFEDEQRNNQRQLAGFQRQLNEMLTGPRRQHEHGQNNANPGRVGMFRDNSGVHIRHRDAANDDSDQNSQESVQQQM